MSELSELEKAFEGIGIIDMLQRTWKHLTSYNLNYMCGLHHGSCGISHEAGDEAYLLFNIYLQRLNDAENHNS